MDLLILSADDSKQMDTICEELSQNKFKIVQQENNFILMVKRRYGNILIQFICLMIALIFSGLFLIINVVYFSYSYLWASPHVLITTEKVSDDGEPLEFSNMDEVLEKANAIL